MHFISSTVLLLGTPYNGSNFLMGTQNRECGYSERVIVLQEMQNYYHNKQFTHLKFFRGVNKSVHVSFDEQRLVHQDNQCGLATVKNLNNKQSNLSFYHEGLLFSNCFV